MGYKYTRISQGNIHLRLRILQRFRLWPVGFRYSFKMADDGSRKRGLDAAENSDEDEEDDMIGPMPAPPPKQKKKRGKCKNETLL